MKYMVKSKILATFCAGLLTVSTGIQAAERLATGTQQKQAQKTVIETSPWFDDKDLTLTGVYYYPEHWMRASGNVTSRKCMNWDLNLPILPSLPGRNWNRKRGAMILHGWTGL